MFKEHSVVYATQRINDKIDVGCIGAIVYVYSDDLFEVEFCDEKMNTIDVVTTSANQIAYKSN